MVHVGASSEAITSIKVRAHAELWKLVVEGCLRSGHGNAVQAQGVSDPSGSKRRKVDTNALASLSASSAEQHISLGKLLQHHELADPSFACRQFQSIVATNMAAGWHALPGGLVYGVTLDAKRLGNHAEELLASVVVNADTTPFQVPGICRDFDQI
eukprot:4475568-Amphidinium_carterae.1